MGKPDENDELSLSSNPNNNANVEEINGFNAERRDLCYCYYCCCNKWCFCRFFKLRCLLPLLLGFSVLISAIFWLPPFFNHTDRGDLDLDPRYRGHTIVASFRLMRPVSFLEDYDEQLEADLSEAFQSTSKVTILSKESSGLNTTNIVFAIDPIYKNSISPMQLSLIRSSFGDLVARRAKFPLAPTEVFKEASFFEVLKFPNGITIIPPQNAYPLQKVQILFNFTLNNSILQIQENFEVLRNQLALGLHLTPNENLYIHLTNARGSTVAPPSTVQTSVVLRVGVPSQPRLKQLAQTIKDSPAKNLGLNNTVFGKVKQVSLSSVLQHSLSGDNAPTPAPAPTPLSPHHLHHHDHHHNHHHNHRHVAFPPTSAPSYPPMETPHPWLSSPPPQMKHHHRGLPSFAPTPSKSYYQTSPPSAYHAPPPGCRFRFKSRHFKRSPEYSPSVGTRAPSMPPRYSAGPTPRPQAKPPTFVAHKISPSSPLPNVIYARVPPPLASEMDPEPPDKMPSVAPSPSCGGQSRATYWLFSLLLPLLLHCWYNVLYSLN